MPSLVIPKSKRPVAGATLRAWSHEGEPLVYIRELQGSGSDRYVDTVAVTVPELRKILEMALLLEKR